jgi:hypothetical protein
MFPLLNLLVLMLIATTATTTTTMTMTMTITALRIFSHGDTLMIGVIRMGRFESAVKITSAHTNLLKWRNAAIVYLGGH